MYFLFTFVMLHVKYIYSPKVLVIPKKRWLHPNMTKKMFTGTLRINQPTCKVNSHEKSSSLRILSPVLV